MAVRFMVGVLCLMLVVATSAQIPTAIEVQTGPPNPDSGKAWEILSIGGWWIKVDAVNATTRKIWLKFGKSPEHLWWHLSWEPRRRSGPIPERDLYPGNLPYSGWVELQPMQVIYVHAETEKTTESASFCVFYKENAVARVDFVGETLKRIDATQREPRCAP